MPLHSTHADVTHKQVHTVVARAQNVRNKDHSIRMSFDFHAHAAVLFVRQEHKHIEIDTMVNVRAHEPKSMRARSVRHPLPA